MKGKNGGLRDTYTLERTVWFRSCFAGCRNCRGLVVKHCHRSFKLRWCFDENVFVQPNEFGDFFKLRLKLKFKNFA